MASRDLRASRWRKIGLLAALYFAQGLPFGFQATALPVYLRQRGLSLEAIGFLGALALPWMLKVLWAPLVDRYGSTRVGARKSWILPTQAGLALTCAVAAAVRPETNLALLLALVLLMNFLAATQDIAVDGLAVDLLGPAELGYGNAAQVVGYKAGMLTGGGLLVWASGRIGWGGLFGAMGALCALVFLVTALAREPSRTAAARNGSWSLRRLGEVLVEALRRPGAIWLLAVVATYKVGESMADAMFKPFLVDAGVSPERIGLIVGTWGLVASLAGSLAGAPLVARVPVLRALGLAAVLRGFSVLGEWYLAVAGPTEASLVAVTVAEHFFGGVLTTVMFAFMMSRVDRRIGASHYTLLASVEVLGKSPGAWASGFVAARMGYAAVFLVGAALSLAYVALLVPLAKAERSASLKESTAS